MVFINCDYSGYDKYGTQKAKGDFLVIFDDYECGKGATNYPDTDIAKLWACVRTVTLSQCGHFMMGKVRIAGKTMLLSGAYGGDGIPCRLKEAFYEGQDERYNHGKYSPMDMRFVHEVPVKLAEKFWNGGGHNSAGSERDELTKWALKNIKLLKSKKKEG